jgi:RNA polymerase sigma-70 factor (ECF subfamily)
MMVVTRYGRATARVVFGRPAMGYDDQTDIGGSQGAFLTTQWSLIENVQAGQDHDRALIGFLLEQYWKPVYCYLRRRGHHNEEAKDLTQGFFHEVVLNKHLVRRADKTKGRFRSFLLHALRQYLAKQAVRDGAQKRIPKDKLVPLDAVAEPLLPDSMVQASPEESYHYAWLSALLERVLAQVRLACEAQGMATHWELFERRVVRPTLDDAPAPSLAELCATHGIASAKQASNMIVTVKRRFRSDLLQAVRQTVLSQGQAPAELEELLSFLPKSAQHRPTLG